MPAAQTERYTTDSGSVQGKHKEGSLQACIWEAALDEEPPNLDPLNFGWVKDDPAKSLGAVPLPQDVPLAPAELLKMIQCMCSSDQPCSSLRCGCNSGQLPCSLFCKCGGADSCCNQMTKTLWQMMLMMIRGIVMIKMRMMISYTMNSNALLFTANILNGQLM